MMQRRSTVRSRAGCLTCRTRRVKCDETKPACKRCYISWQVCEYSPLPHEHISSPRKGARKINQVPGQHVFVLERDSQSSSVDIHKLPKSLPSAYTQEYISQLDYFRTVCRASFVTVVDTKFWNNLVLQVSSTEPAIQEAIVALASLHKMKYFKSYGPNDPQPFVQYHRAIQNLNRRLDASVRSQQVALIASILFSIFEEQSGNQEGAAKHADGGFAIMREVISARPSAIHTPGVFQDISKSLLCLDIMFSIQGHGYQTRSFQPLRLPEIFQNEFEAYKAIHAIVAHILRLKSSHRHCECKDPLTGTHRDIVLSLASSREYLQDWHLKFNAIQISDEKATFRIHDQPVHDTALFTYHILQIVIATFCPSNELAHEGFVSNFVQIFEMASRILRGSPIINIATDSSNNGQATFSPTFMMGFRVPTSIPSTSQAPKTPDQLEILADVVVGVYSTVRKFRHQNIRTRVVQMINFAGLGEVFDEAHAQLKTEKANGVSEAIFEPPEKSMEAFEVAFDRLNEIIKNRGPVKSGVPDWVLSYFLKNPYPEQW